ncbi:MAG: glutamate-5-semialdehyde dehydrogenase [Clostridiaceae bacterium]|nr:glutamate-5-semialdehyde dehydrogenase [Clostridiaceae bacterium]
MTIKEKARLLKADAPYLANSAHEQRNQALENMGKKLSEHKASIFAANEKDLAGARENNLPPALINRLVFDEVKFADALAGLADLQNMPDPLGKELLRRQLDEGLILVQESCPLGVLGVIFEARPDALIQISALCIKSGNAAMLKGGSEAAESNRVIFDLLYQAAIEAALPENCLALAETHSEIKELLSCHEEVDLLVPRGSNAFVQYIMENTRIPVLGHADGICHIYVDPGADLKQSIKIIIDAKTQYPAACNAVETVLVHENLAETFLPLLSAALNEVGVRIRGTAAVQEYIDCELTDEADFSTEYSDLILTLALVADCDQAIKHINYYGSHHTDAILAEDEETINSFLHLVDSASVYVNCSTRFADGYRYGLGAELGISTGKLHARGPAGLEALVTYKYKLCGQGHLVADYAEGRKQFHFEDLDI